VAATNPVTHSDDSALVRAIVIGALPTLHLSMSHQNSILVTNPVVQAGFARPTDKCLVVPGRE